MSTNDKKLEKLKQLFDGVNSLEELQQRLEPPAVRELLRRAAALRHFDKGVYKNYLTHKLPGEYPSDFADFVRNANIEPVPRTRDLYRVKEEARRPCLDELRAEQNEGGEAKLNNDEVFARLLKHYKGAGPEGEFDRLAMLIVTDTARAGERLEQLYAEADARFDMARCNDLLRIFEARTQLLDEGLRQLCLRLRQYYNARNLYAADFYQTATYLARGTMSEDFTGFLMPSAGVGGEWIYHIYATGGMGKTMFLRWLISRCCVPERIPVARLDFDMLDLTSSSLYPTLLLLPIAEQLDQQIEGRPFNEALKSMWVFKPLLDRPTGGEHDAKRYDLERSFHLVAPEWTKTAIPEFCRVLGEAGFHGPIVIAIDTLEEMMFRRGQSLARVVMQIAEIHDAYKGLRLVLSGRYDLRDGLKGLEQIDDLLKRQAVNYELKRFTPDEARVYLTEKRGLKQDDELVEAIVSKCTVAVEVVDSDGSVVEERAINPFILSLMADLVVSKDIKTVEDVRRLPRAEVAYLIKRVIERINDHDIHWMLRYASVPRLFTLELLKEVMWPHLLEEREKLRGKDSRKRIAGGEYDQTAYFPPGDSGSAAEAWDKLKPYVSSYGWVSFDTTDGTRLRLHPDVSIPMRMLLSGEEVYPLLHRDAARYFERKANAAPEQWAAWICEAVYHQFQLNGRKGASFWREQLASRRAASDMEMRERVASEITRRDYVDENGLPLRRSEDSDETIVSMANLCEAYNEAAVASIMLTAKHSQGTGDYAVAWEKAGAHLTKLVAVVKTAGDSSFKPRFDVDAFDRLAAELAKMLLDYDVVLPLAEQALASTESPFLKLSLTIQLAEMYAGRDADKAEYYFKQARDTSKFLSVPFLSPVAATLKLAQWYQSQGRFADALTEYADALDRRDVDSAAARNIKRRMAKANAEVGRYSTAARLSRESLETNLAAPGSDDEWDGALLLNRLEAQELLLPLPALRATSTLRRAARTVDNNRRHAEVMELRGYALGQLMHFEEALEALGHAMQLWDTVNDPSGADRALMYRVELHLNQIGDVSGAAALLSQWEMQSGKKDAELACQMELLSVRCQMFMARRDEARERWEALSNRADVTHSPRSLVRSLAIGVAFGFGGAKAYDRLLAALEKIEPASARLPLLAGLGLASEDADDEPLGVTRSRLLKRLEWPPEKRETLSSTIVYAQLLHWCGDARKAEKILTSATVKAQRDGNSFAFARGLSALSNVGYAPPPELSIYHSTFLDDYKQCPALRRAALVEEAERALSTRMFDACERALQDSQEAAVAAQLPSMGTKWEALATEIAACLAEQTGDHKRAESNLEVACSIYTRLGDERSVTRVKGKLVAPRGRAGEPASPPREHTQILRLDVVNSAVVVNSIRDFDILTYTPLQDTQALTSTLRDRSSIFELTSWMVKDFYTFMQALWEILFVEQAGPPLGYPAYGPPLDLRLEIPAAALAKIPWEMASSNMAVGLPAAYRYVYRGGPYSESLGGIAQWVQLAVRQLLDVPTLRIDGILGPLTVNALTEAGVDADKLGTIELHTELARRLRARTGAMPYRALLITPSIESRVVAQRSLEGIEHVPLRYLYGGPFEVEVVEVDDQQTLAMMLPGVLREFRPQLIHVESAFKASPTTGQVYLDFNVVARRHDVEAFHDSAGPSGRVQFSPVLLNDMLLKWPESQQRPLVVFEAQSPPGESAAAVQLLLRNSFASELFHLGNTCGVVATGLFPPAEARQRMLTPFINSLADGLFFGEAINTLNAELDYREAVSFRDAPAAALFTESPLLTLLPR